MSYDTHKNWFYELYGRKIHLWQWTETAATDTLGGIRIKLPAEFYGNQLIYPNEDITDGLRIEYTVLYEPFVTEALETTTARASGTGIAFVDGGVGVDRITDSNNGLGDFEVDDKIRVIGSASNDGDYTVTVDGGVGSISVATGSLTAETASESITIYQIPKEVTGTDITETSHVNLNRQLSLSVVDYIKAKVAEMSGQFEMGQYFMKQFYGKIGDKSNNLRKVSVQNTVSPYALR
jgi:hypothetical protein